MISQKSSSTIKLGDKYCS